jgi:hypothetical protein
MKSWPDHSPSGNQKRFWRKSFYGFLEIALVFVRLDHVALTGFNAFPHLSA